MITEKDLLEAIAECQGVRNPNTNTCIKLASFYTILDHIQNSDKVDMYPSYSYASGPRTSESSTEFMELVNNAELNHIIPIMDELMSTLQIINPKLYNGVIQKIKNR